MKWVTVRYRGIEFTVSSSAHVIYNGRFLQQVGRPYKMVRVWSTKHAVHKIIAKAFCKVYKPHLVVNHKDANKQNNRANNLEYCTKGQNVRHAFDMGLIKRSGKVLRRKSQLHYMMDAHV